MTAGELDLTKVLTALHGHAIVVLRDVDAGDQVAGGGVRVAKTKRFAFHIVQVSDPVVFAGETDGMIADGTVDVNFDQNRLNRLRVLQEGRCLGGCAQPRHVNGAAQQALDHTV